jgi:hypothetical protein
MGATYKHDYRAFGDHVLRAAFMESDMVRRALNVQANAEFLASDHVDTGRFESSYVTESGRTGGGRKRDRAFGRVRNVDPKAAHIELGHNIITGKRYTDKGRKRKREVKGHVEGLHTLTRSLDAAGD